MPGIYKGYLDYTRKLLREDASVEPNEDLQQVFTYGLLNTRYGLTRVTNKKFLLNLKSKGKLELLRDFLTQVKHDMDPKLNANIFTRNIFSIDTLVTWHSMIFSMIFGLFFLISSAIESAEDPWRGLQLCIVSLFCFCIATLALLMRLVHYLFKLKNKNYYVFTANCERWNWIKLVEENRMSAYSFFNTTEMSRCKEYKQAVQYAINKGAIVNLQFLESELISDDELGDIKIIENLP